MLSFLTRINALPPKNPEQDIFIPYQFLDIAQHCVGKVVGTIVLANGEILLIKNRDICFAKRGRKWVYQIKTIAPCIMPDILAFYESEENQRKFAEWKKRREAEKQKTKTN